MSAPTFAADTTEPEQTAPRDVSLRGDGWGWIDAPIASVDNDQQSSGGNVWGYSGNEADAALAASSAGVALGNTASATVTEDVSVQIENIQALDGNVESNAEGYFGEAGPVSTNATAYGNSFTAESENADIGMVSEQTAGAGIIQSRALIEAADYAQSAAGSATTGANTVSLGAGQAYAGLEAYQSNSAEVAATVDILAPQADVPVAVGTAIAVINNADLGAQGDAALAAAQDNSGAGTARTRIQADGTIASVGTAIITGNNLNMINEGGVGMFAAEQNNSGDLMGQSLLDVGLFGEATSTAAAIGNNASSTTTGSSADIQTVQNNSGAVIAQALFTGGSGMAATSTATAYGNAAGGALCNCDGDMSAYNHQTNSGPVRAHTYNLANDAGVLTATSVAAGNTATYTVGSPD